MTNHSESAGSMPADETRPNWSWLQDRISPAATEQLERWLSEELALLEENYASLVTANSRSRAFRRELSRDRSRD